MSTFNVYGETKIWLEREKIVLQASPTATSTNDQAKEEAFSLSLPLKIYLCDQQTSGRGRGTHEWLNSATGAALLITLSFNVESSPQPITAPLIGLKIFESLRNSLSLKNLSLKAPNDILLDGKKVAGILVETLKSGPRYRLVVGLGLNVFSHPTEIADSKDLGLNISLNQWHVFLSALISSMKFAAHECMATHFCESERAGLLEAINLNPNLPQKFDSISPFGDLIGPNGTISWRDL